MPRARPVALLGATRTCRGLFRLAVLLPVLLIAVSLGPGPARGDVYTSPQTIEAGFRQGLAALSAGDAARAIRLFRAILAEHPGLPRVRLELARAYFVAREWDRSRREFFAVLSGGVPATVKRNILRFLREIDARRGFDWDLSVAFSTAPQARRDYDTDIVEIEAFGIPLPFEIERETDGSHGVRASGDAEYRVEIPGARRGGVRLTAFGGAFFDIFEGEGSGADDYVIGGGAGLRAAWPQTTVFGGPRVSMRHFSGRHLENRFGFDGGMEWRNASGLSIFASGSVGVVADQVSDARDGTFGRLRGGVARSLGGRAMAGVALDAEFFDADARFESHRVLGGEVFGRADLGLGLDATARLYLLNQTFDDPVPLLGATRKEWEYGVDIELAKTDLFLLGQFTPFVTAGYSRRSSSIDAFSYKEVRFEVGLRRAF